MPGLVGNSRGIKMARIQGLVRTSRAINMAGMQGLVGNDKGNTLFAAETSEQWSAWIDSLQRPDRGDCHH